MITSLLPCIAAVEYNDSNSDGVMLRSRHC